MKNQTIHQAKQLRRPCSTLPTIRLTALHWSFWQTGASKTLQRASQGVSALGSRRIPAHSGAANRYILLLKQSAISPDPGKGEAIAMADWRVA